MSLDTRTEKIQEVRNTLYLKAYSEEIEPEVDHLELPKEDAVVKPVVGLRKWHGPESSCRATQRAEGTNPRRLWSEYR